MRNETKISERAALLNRMYDEETELEKQLAEMAKEMERILDRRDAIRCCRVALERRIDDERRTNT